MPFSRWKGKQTVVHPDTGILVIFQWKEMSFQDTKRHRGILDAYYKVKEANLKRLHTVQFQLHDILEKAKL